MQEYSSQISYLKQLFVFSEPKGTILPLLVEPRAEKLRKIQRHAWVGDHILLPCVAQGFPVPETT